MKDYLLFDLDGTLTDPKVGICTCVQYALRSFGIEEPDLDKLEPFIGPPLSQSFMQFYDMSEADAKVAVEKYRERFQNIGIFENEVYRGIPGMLKKLKAEGFHLAVASSKPTVYVKRILEHFHIAEYFEVVMGSELDGSRGNKSEVVEEALRQLFAAGPGEQDKGSNTQKESSDATFLDTRVQKDRVYMVGDTRFDVEGARACGVESVGVSYGYGSLEDLMQAHADYIVRSVEELQSFLLREVRDRKEPQEVFSLFINLLIPLLLFMVVRAIVTIVLGRLVYEDPPILTKVIVDFFVHSENGLRSFTPNGSVTINLLAFLYAGAAIFSHAREEIVWACEDTRLTHLRMKPTSKYLLLAGATICGVIGMNLLLALTGIVEGSADYNAFARTNEQVSFSLGLLIYGIVSPVAEELLFRGLLYNRLRSFARRYPVGSEHAGAHSPIWRLSRTLPAILISAALFGLYHMNIVQGIYAFTLGCLIAYGYEYFGSFLVPVFMHAGANILAWLVPISALTRLGEHGSIWGAFVCAASLLASAGCVYGMQTGKKRK